MKYIVDSMLGKLAKRLRFLGLDTYFDAALNDREILKISKAEDRVVITRDRGISLIKDAKVILIKSTEINEQLKEFEKLTGATFNERIAFSRCPECNEPVARVSKDSVKNIVPAKVYETMNEFSYCKKCKKAYWHGSHYEHIVKELKAK